MNMSPPAAMVQVSAWSHARSAGALTVATNGHALSFWTWSSPMRSAPSIASARICGPRSDPRTTPSQPDLIFARISVGVPDSTEPSTVIPSAWPIASALPADTITPLKSPFCPSRAAFRSCVEMVSRVDQKSTTGTIGICRSVSGPVGGAGVVDGDRVLSDSPGPTDSTGMDAGGTGLVPSVDACVSAGSCDSDGRGALDVSAGNDAPGGTGDGLGLAVKAITAKPAAPMTNSDTSAITTTYDAIDRDPRGCCRIGPSGATGCVGGMPYQGWLLGS